MAWAKVQEVTGSTGATPATSLALTVAAPATNNLVVLCVSSTDESASIPANDNTHVSSITQTNVTWTKAVNTNWAFNGFKGADIWYAIAGTSPGTGVTIAVANGGSTTCDILADYLEWSGNIIAGTLDTSSSTTGSSGTFSTSAITTSRGNELIIAMLGGNLTTGGPNNGTVLQTNMNVNGPNAGAQLSDSYRIGSIGSYSETWTGVSAQFGALMVSFFGGGVSPSPAAGGHIRVWTMINRK